MPARVVCKAARIAWICFSTREKTKTHIKNADICKAAKGLQLSAGPQELLDLLLKTKENQKAHLLEEAHKLHRCKTGGVASTLHYA